MKTINLKDFYYWYTQDEFIEVTDEVAAELYKGKRCDKSHERQMYRYKAQYSLDVKNGCTISFTSANKTTTDPMTTIKEILLSAYRTKQVKG